MNAITANLSGFHLSRQGSSFSRCHTSYRIYGILFWSDPHVEMFVDYSGVGHGKTVVHHS